MFSYSKSLDNVSNNIANMNTPGYRGNDAFMRSVGGEQGYGTSLEDIGARQQAGEIRQTGNQTDLAVVGEGYFIVQDESGENYYTRAGQFKFNEDSQLVDALSGYQVMALTEGGDLEGFSIADQRVLPPEATSEITFAGNLSSSSTDFESEAFEIFSADGEMHELRIRLTNNSAVLLNSWSGELVDASDTVIDTFELRFNVDGSPQTDFNAYTGAVTLGADPQDLTISFGEAGGFEGVTHFSGSTSTLASAVEDGHGALGIANLSFDGEGIIQLQYTNGDDVAGQQVALASFYDQSELISVDGSVFKARPAQDISLGVAQSEQFGVIRDKSIELSNVDLTQEFADILIIQRGYQASSKVMGVANELIEQLYNSTSGR